MILIMVVSLYTSRVILQVLGIEDFGIYNVVAGIVVLFTFINNAMATASQRYLSFSIGKGDLNETNRIFSMSLTSHLAIALVVLLIAETLGLWFLLTQMNFPQNRMTAVVWTYQLSILICCLQIIRVPYNASIIAYEKMSFYAWISILEAFLKLLIVILLQKFSGDNLITFSILTLIVVIIINVAYKIYCNFYFKTTHYYFYWDTNLFKEFTSFSGWSLIGSLANISAQQGLNIILNIFCGVAVNAAVGISNQVMAAISSFLSNFQTAFNPQIVKSYAENNKEYFMELIFKTSKYSYYLMFLICIPVLINCDFLLHLWLTNIPRYATEFSQLMIIFLLLDAISGPLWYSIQATGKIKNYQILMGVIILSNLPLSLIILYFKVSPIYVFILRVILNFVTLIARIIYLKPIINLSPKLFGQEVLLKIFEISLISVPIPIIIGLFTNGWERIIITTILSIFISIVTIYFIGLNNIEKEYFRKIIKKIVPLK